MGLLDFLKKHKKQKNHKICCDRCKRELLEDEAEQIGNHRVCKNCALPSSASVPSDQVPQREMDTRPAAHLSARAEELELLFSIKTDGHMATALYLHKTTGEPYIVASSLEQRGGGYLEQYHSITKATSSDMDAIASHQKEFDYETAYQFRNVIFDFRKMGKTFSIDAHRYRYMVYLLVGDVEIFARGVMLSEDKVRIPAAYLSGKQYAQYLVCPGPYEHAYELPVGCIDKVMIRVEAC